MAVKSADQITIVDVTDAYSVILTSETYTFIGNTTGAVSGETCSTQVVAFCGTNQCSNVSVSVDDIQCPTGISASVANSGTNAVTVTFTTTATITTATEPCFAFLDFKKLLKPPLCHCSLVAGNFDVSLAGAMVALTPVVPLIFAIYSPFNISILKLLL